MTASVSDWLLRYRGHRALIIGKGPTTYDFHKLQTDVDDQTHAMFINDAVQLERFLPENAPESFFACLDDHQARYWLSHPVRSTCLMKAVHKPYHQMNRVIWFMHVMDAVPIQTRLEFSRNPRIGLRDGTVCVLLQWCWYVGIRRIGFIGCDCINDPSLVRRLTGGKDYNPQIETVVPGAVCRWRNDAIRLSQEALCEMFGFDVEYIGTPSLPERLPVKYVSFATPSYEPLLKRLSDTAREFGLDFYGEILFDAGKWIRNCAQKPLFLWRCRQLWPGRRLVWIDADAMIRKSPVLFDELPPDVTVAFAKRNDEVLSGTVFIGDTPASDALLLEWATEQQACPDEADQKVLARVVHRHPEWKTVILPTAYTFIFDLSRQEHPDTEPVIEHFQASREMRSRQRMI